MSFSHQSNDQCDGAPSPPLPEAHSHIWLDQFLRYLCVKRTCSTISWTVRSDGRNRGYNRYANSADNATLNCDGVGYRAAKWRRAPAAMRTGRTRSGYAAVIRETTSLALADVRAAASNASR